MRMHRAPGALLLATLSCSTRSEGDARIRSQAALVAHAVHQLREAPGGQKRPPLQVLQGTSCGEPLACRVKAVCAEGYELEAGAEETLVEVRRSLERPGEPVPGTAGEAISRAESALRRSRDLTSRCADLEAELRRAQGL